MREVRLGTKWLWAAAGYLLAAAGAGASVYNISLTTDNAPDLTDMKSYVASITGHLAPNDHEGRCKAVWRWSQRGRRQTSAPFEDGMDVIDPILFYSSYGYTYCGYTAGINDALWTFMGYPVRYVELGDHTVSEVFYGGAWHMFDTAMSFCCYNHRGQIASCEDIKASGSCELSRGKVEPGHVYLYHYSPECGTNPKGWRCASDDPYIRSLESGASSYIDGFSPSAFQTMARWGHRYILNLRPHENYTRYWEPLDGDRNDPDYFRPIEGKGDPDDLHGLNNIRGNGVWEFTPDLSTKDCRNLIHDESGIELREDSGGDGPNLHPASVATTAVVVFKVCSANVTTSARIQARGVCKTRADRLAISVSRDNGINWVRVWEAKDAGEITADVRVRNEVAGRTEYLVKVSMFAARAKQDCGLESIRLETITQLNRRTMPKLTLGANRVQVRVGEQTETITFWPSVIGGRHRETVADERDIYSTDKLGYYFAQMGAAKNNADCYSTWRLNAPADIVRVTYGGNYCNRSPQSRIEYAHSWDGRDFVKDYSYSSGETPFDQRHFVELAGDAIPQSARSFSARYSFFCRNGAATYNTPGMQDVLMHIQHRPHDARFQPIEVTYCWTEYRETGPVERRHTELAQSVPHSYTIHVGGKRDPTMNWVRVNLRGFGPAGGRYGYWDGEDVGDAFARKKVVFHWGRNLARGCAYEITGKPDPRNPETSGHDLTDGIIAPPTEYASEKWMPTNILWPAGTTPAVRLDLGAIQSVAAVRVCAVQPEPRVGAYAYPARIAVEISADGVSWTNAGTIRHDDVWSPPGDFLPWEHEDDPSYDVLPAGGRLAFCFPLILPQPAQARYIRLSCEPLKGWGMGLSEVEVYDSVTVKPWPDEINPNVQE
jgi:hypothetical protein